MPTYDYACTECEMCFERHHPMNARKPACPGCGGETKRLVLVAPATHGFAARGRELAAASLPVCGKGCRCCP